MKPQPVKNSSWEVKSFGKAIDILECFTFERKEMSLVDIVTQTGLNRTTARRLIANLESRHLLKKDPLSKKYALGLRLFEMGAIVYSSFSLRRSAFLPMTRLQNEVKATILLGARENDHIVYLEKREEPGMIAISAVLGLIRPITFGLLGRILMAYLDPEEVEAIIKRNPLKQYTPHSITEKKALRSQLDQAREQGYAMEVNEFVEGVMGIAAPIRDYSRKAIGGIGVYLPALESENADEIGRITKLLITIAGEISKDIGYLKT